MHPGFTALFEICSGMSSFFSVGNGSDSGGAAFISFCKYLGWYSIGISLDHSFPFFLTQRFAAEWGGLMHDVWNLRSVDDLEFQSAVWLDNYLGD